jgi:hypothetical protein
MASRDERGRFISGNTGGPGRPKGARNKLSEEFLHALYEDFVAHGREAIRRVAAESQGEYLRLIASVIPKQIGAERENVLASISAERLDEIILAVDAWIEENVAAEAGCVLRTDV